MKKVIAVVALICLSWPLHAQETPSRYVVEGPAFPEPPKIDGHLREEVWEEAVLLKGFTQLEPEEGAPATEKTEVLIGYDERKLYVGVRCFVSEPGKIVSVVMDRDGNFFNEDSIRIVLDTFHDKKSGFLFAINPLGAQLDALVRGEGEQVNISWDGIWYSATVRSGDAWTAEIAIPFRTLRFPVAEIQTWGLNIQRTSIHNREYSLWKPTPRQGDPLLRMSQAGELLGLRGLQPGRSFDVKPYLSARADRGDTLGEGTSFEVGIDVKKSITSELVLDLTYNLDFAEAEADNQQVNLTRFKLFFPEKRDFFLEGSNLFYFGERGDFIRGPERIFFFSRQIGLAADGLREIPVLGGAKVSGYAGGLGIGLLNLTTEDFTYRDRAGDEQHEAETNFTVARLRKDILEKSSVGLMWLNKEVSGGADNSGVGVDWDFGLGPHIKTGGFVAQTSTDGLDGDDWAAVADFAWESEFFYTKSSYAEVGENFNPEMGFFPRVGIREYRSNVTFIPRPKVWGLRDILIFDDFTYVTDRDGNLESRFNRAEVDLQWKSYSTISFKFFDQVEVLDRPFEIHPGVVIAPGRYSFQNYFVGAQTIPGRPVFAFARIHVGDFYGGTFSTLFAGTRLRPAKGLVSKITFEHTDVKLPEGDFIVDLVSVYVVYSVSPRLSGRALVEWRRDDNLNANISIRWTYKPGAAFYLVYDEFRNLLERPAGVGKTTDRNVIAKMTFFF